MNKIVLGIDQSYQDTGLAIAYNNKIVAITDCKMSNYERNTDKRNCLGYKLESLLSLVRDKEYIYKAEAIVIIERIRLQSKGFINIDYIKSIGALNALIVDIAAAYEFPVYSVDTRSWKSQVVGTSKTLENKYGIAPEKYPTIQYVISKGYEKDIKEYVSSKKKKGIVGEDEKGRYTYNDNKADAACIALYGFCKNQKLKDEH